MYGHGATCRTSGASRPTPSAPALAARAERHHASHVRSAAIDVRRAWSSSAGGSAGAAVAAASVVPPGVSMAPIVPDRPTDFHRPYASGPSATFDRKSRPSITAGLCPRPLEMHRGIPSGLRPCPAAPPAALSMPTVTRRTTDPAPMDVAAPAPPDPPAADRPPL